MRLGDERVQVSKSPSKNRSYDAERVRGMIHSNKEIDYVILLSLYQHRALTAEQLYRIGKFNLHINSLRNRLRTLADRKVLSVNSRAGIKSVPVLVYSLSLYGLRILIEDILKVKEYVPQLDDYKEHYTLDDLKVRGQHEHFYEVQDWLSLYLSRQPESFHCEWRRYPIFDDDETISYRPDWMIFEKTEEWEEEKKVNPTSNPLLYPYFFRRTTFDDQFLKLMVSVECDRGTMSRTELVDKWEAYKKEGEEMTSKSLVMFYPKQVNGTTRHRNIRETMIYSFENELIDEKIHIFQGEKESTAQAVSLFVEREGNVLLNEPMTDRNSIRILVENYRTENKKAAYLEVSDEVVEKLSLPLKPDHIVLIEGEEDEIQIIFNGMTNWVNPIGKVRTIEKWIKEGGLSIFQQIKLILLYPDNESFKRDITFVSKYLHYASYSEVSELGYWGKVHREERKHNKVQWREVLL